MPKPKNYRKSSRNVVENRMAQQLDKLTAFDEFVSAFPEDLRKLLQSGASSEKLYAKYKELLTAKQLAIALREQDSAKALHAIERLQDRHEGKPSQRTETVHKYEKLDDAQIDAKLESLLKEAGDAEDGTTDTPSVQ